MSMYHKGGTRMLAALKFGEIKFNKKETKIQNIPVDQIRPNPYQPRKYFDRIALEELAASIRQYGVMQPVNVRLINGCSYELVSGERRLRASKLAGNETIPAIIVNVSDNDSGIIALIENLQRQNLNYIEEAEGYYNLMEDYAITQEELAVKLGKNQSTIANKVRLLKLSPEIQKLLIENHLTERHARALLKIPDPDVQTLIVKRVIAQELNVKKTEELVSQTMVKMSQGIIPKEEQHVKRSFGDIRLFTNTLKQSLDIIKKSGAKTKCEIEEKNDSYEIKIVIAYGDDFESI